VCGKSPGTDEACEAIRLGEVTRGVYTRGGLEQGSLRTWLWARFVEKKGGGWVSSFRLSPAFVPWPGKLREKDGCWQRNTCENKEIKIV
jgi:hypothetical protein